jgi:hypothetical protein
MTSVKIIFDSPNPTFSPSSEVYGYVLVETSKPIKADQIILKATGKGITSFFRSKPNLIKNFTKPLINYKAEEMYLNEKYILWQSPDKTAKFPVGSQKFDFVFELPKECQPSFAFKEAKIVYSLKADIFYSKKSIASDETVFNVSSNPDLILKDVLGNFGKKEAKFLSSHSSSHPVEAKIILPKKVYAPGEQLNLVVEILNDSDFAVASINTGIISLVYCKGQATFGKTTPVTKEEKEVIKSQEEVLEEKINVEPDSFYKYTRTIIVPKLVPNVFDSNIITTVHTVYITIHSSSNTVLIGSIPIVISTHISHSEPHQSQSAHAHLVPPPRFPSHHQHIEESSTAPSITLKKHAPLTQKYSNASNASSIHSQKSPYSSLNTSTSSLTSNSSDSKPKKSVRFNDELNIKICNDNFISI